MQGPTLEELIESLKDSLKSTVHYMNGILQDIERGDYTPEQALADVDYFDGNGGVDFFSTIREISEYTDIPDNITPLRT